MLNQISELGRAYKDTQRATSKRVAVTTTKLEGFKRELSRLQIEYRAKPFYIRFFVGISYFLDSSEIESKIRKTKQKLERHQGQVKADLIQFIKGAGEVSIASNPDAKLKQENLLKQEKEQRQAHSVASDLCAKGVDAISAINAALSSISDAEDMEVLDMVSSNKGIAALSTMNNYDASNDIAEAQDAINEFKDALGKVKDHDNLPEAVDFVFDMLFDDMFLDLVGGFFVLSALSESKDSLNEAFNKIEPIAEKLKNKEHELGNDLKQVQSELLLHKRSHWHALTPQMSAFSTVITPEFLDEIGVS